MWGSIKAVCVEDQKFNLKNTSDFIPEYFMVEFGKL